MATVALPRGPDGKIIVDSPAPLIDDEALRELDAMTARPAEPTTATPSPAPAPERKRGDAPTPISQLRPDQPGGEEASGPAMTWYHWVAAAAAVALVALAVWAVWPRSDRQPGAPAATPAAARATQAPNGQLVLDRAVVAYASPDGALLGAIEAGRSYMPLGGQDGWQQLDVDGSGAVWVRWAELGIVPTAAPPAPTDTPAVESVIVEAAPAIVGVEQPIAALAVAPDPTIVSDLEPTPAPLEPIRTTEAGHVVVEDTDERYVERDPSAPPREYGQGGGGGGSYAEPTAEARSSGGGGSWGDGQAARP